MSSESRSRFFPGGLLNPPSPRSPFAPGRFLNPHRPCSPFDFCLHRVTPEFAQALVAQGGGFVACAHVPLGSARGMAEDGGVVLCVGCKLVASWESKAGKFVPGPILEPWLLSFWESRRWALMPGPARGPALDPKSAPEPTLRPEPRLRFEPELRPRL
jgi:hypothetical protein